MAGVCRQEGKGSTIVLAVVTFCWQDSLVSSAFFFPLGVRFSRGAAPIVKLESLCPGEQSHGRKRAESSGCLPF